MCVYTIKLVHEVICHMYNNNNEFAERLTQLRMQKGVSARDMCLSIGQNAGYIHNIESGKALPSMTAFFYICEYLDISPKDFFDTDLQAPNKYQNFLESTQKLNSKKIEILTDLINEFSK